MRVDAVAQRAMVLLPKVRPSPVTTSHSGPSRPGEPASLLSGKTVRNRVSDILAKLHARSRAEMVALARDAGLGG